MFTSGFQLAAGSALPGMLLCGSTSRSAVSHGYGAGNFLYAYRRAAVYVDKILRVSKAESRPPQSNPRSLTW